MSFYFKNFPAKNLVQTNVTKKWKCKKAGEDSAFVVLKLSKPYYITQIDIGNESSGMIAVLVGDSTQDPPKFQEILLATSFMTINEARLENNQNRVRMFNKELFIQTTAKKKWDLVKVLCTQKFNNRKQYGLSFINLYTSEEDEDTSDDDSPIKPMPVIQLPAASNSKPRISCGKFFFRDSSSDDEQMSHFKKWKLEKTTISTTAVTSKSSSQNSLKRSRSEDNDKKLAQDRNRTKGLVYESDDDEPNEKLQRKIDKDKELKEKERHVPRFSRLSASSLPTASPKSSNKFASFVNESKPSVSTSSLKSPTKPIQYQPFGKLLEGVTFVLSGYQNPERGIIRQKAIDMGAKYKGDWNSDCTHLM
jgi:DNA-repair protein XRCC1